MGRHPRAQPPAERVVTLEQKPGPGPSTWAPCPPASTTCTAAPPRAARTASRPATSCNSA
eukprot:3515955-Pyramimonas_sp.AAC.1